MILNAAQTVSFKQFNGGIYNVGGSPGATSGTRQGLDFMQMMQLLPGNKCYSQQAGASIGQPEETYGMLPDQAKWQSLYGDLLLQLNGIDTGAVYQNGESENALTGYLTLGQTTAEIDMDPLNAGPFKFLYRYLAGLMDTAEQEQGESPLPQFIESGTVASPFTTLPITGMTNAAAPELNEPGIIAATLLNMFKTGLTNTAAPELNESGAIAATFPALLNTQMIDPLLPAFSESEKPANKETILQLINAAALEMGRGNNTKAEEFLTKLLQEFGVKPEVARQTGLTAGLYRMLENLVLKPQNPVGQVQDPAWLRDSSFAGVMSQSILQRHGAEQAVSSGARPETVPQIQNDASGISSAALNLQQKPERETGQSAASLKPPLTTGQATGVTSSGELQVNDESGEEEALLKGFQVSRPVTGKSAGIPGQYQIIQNAAGMSKETPEVKQQIEQLNNLNNINSLNGTGKSAASEAVPAVRVNPNNFTAQLAEIVRWQSVNNNVNGQTQVRLKLHPEQLGEILVKMVYKDGNMTTHFQATTEYARQIIESSLPQLRESLASFQVNLQNTSVSVGGESGRWNQDWGGDKNGRGQRDKTAAARETVREAAGGIEASSNVTANSGNLNYFV